MGPYEIIWVHIRNLSGLIWYLKNDGNIEIFKIFVAREKKDKTAFLPLVLLRGAEGAVQNWHGKTCASDRRSDSTWGRLEWKGYKTSAGAWQKFPFKIQWSFDVAFLQTKDDLLFITVCLRLLGTLQTTYGSRPVPGKFLMNGKAR